MRIDLSGWKTGAVFEPEGKPSGTVPVTGAPNPAAGSNQPDLPADPSQETGRSEPGIRFIDEAFNALADPEQGQGNLRPQQQQPTDPAQAQPPAQPQYPQPVQVPQPQVAQPQAPVAPGQTATEVRTQQPVPLTPEQQQEQQTRERARSDPFGMQAEMLQAQEQAYVGALAEQVYPISQQDMDAFLSGDGSKVSQALARVHVNAVGSVMKVVSQQLPMMLGHYIRMHSMAQERENSFYEVNGFLDRKVHGPLVAQVARTYRQMYPQATDDQIDKAVGIMVAAAAGVQVPPGAHQPAGAPKQHVDANGVRTPGKVVRQTSQPFAPAGNGVGGAPRPPELGQWGEITEIVQADQRGVFDR